MTKFIWKKKEYYLLFNANIHFAIEDKYENKSVTDILNEKGQLGLYNICWLLEKLNTQAELLRAYEGYEKNQTLKSGELILMLKPFEIIEAKKAIMEAVIEGYKQDEESNEEIDLGLLELQKKTAID